MRSNIYRPQIKTLLLMLTLQCYFTDELDFSEVTGDAPNLDSAVNKTDNSFLSPDGTMWVEVTNHNEVATGSMPSQNVLRSRPGPTSYAKRKVIEGSIMSAFTLFIDDFLIREIVSCTETEARSKLKNDTWSTSKKKSTPILEYFLLEVSLPKDSESMAYGPKFGDPRFSERP